MRTEAIDMRDDETDRVFRSLRMDSLTTFLRLADGRTDIVGDLERTLLHEALAHGKADVAFALIERGAPLDARDALGRSPLHYAAMFGQTDVAKAIIAGGGDVNALDRHGNNPLWTAVLNPEADQELIALLVEHGADVRSANNAGRSVQDMAEILADNDILRIVGRAG